MKNDMNWEEFVEMDFPEEFNFEHMYILEEDEDGIEGKLKRYFTQKFAGEKSDCEKNYPNAAKFIDEVTYIYGKTPDCDGTLWNRTVCELTRCIYRELWDWDDKGKRYGMTENKEFGEMGPDTMNSAQTTLNAIVTNEFNECKDDKVTSIQKGRYSQLLTLELLENKNSRQTLIGWLNNVEGLSDYLDLYHTMGNFALVPAHLNSSRGTDYLLKDYWDRSLLALKDGYACRLKDRSGKVEWNRELFPRYINTYFLWDYVEKQCEITTDEGISSGFCYECKSFTGDGDIESFMDNKCLIEDFLKKTCQVIKQRGRFMTAMLKIKKHDKEIGSDCYGELRQKIFDTDTVYNGYDDVIDMIKGMPWYEELHEVHKLFDSILQNNIC